MSSTKVWRELQQHYHYTKQKTLREHFDRESDRGNVMVLEHDGIYLDYSKNLLTDETLPLLRGLLDEADVASAIDAMFTGERINTTEQRSVLHVAQRMPKDSTLLVDGKNIVSEVHAVLSRMARFAKQVRAGEWKGHSGATIRNIVHIGIGGAEIGPHMACDALTDYQGKDLNAYFISNIDPADFRKVSETLNPNETLFIVSSKSFSTIETLTNAHSARQWIVNYAGDEAAIAQHFVAISTNTQAVQEFGINPENMFEMWDWVGGRFSLMGATGLIVMIMIGPKHFKELLDGAHSIDEHFRKAPVEQNIPITLALISIWYNNFYGYETELFLPYSANFDRFATYFQQGNMESNGKSVRLDGSAVTTATGPIIWGRPGTDSQHTFMQHVHQGTHTMPADFLLFKQPFKDINGQHELLLANALAQSEALAFGKSEDELIEEGVAKELTPHLHMPGNKPSNTLIFEKLTPYTFGQLIALYEHKIFVQGVIWGINSFDQWGVQLGKVLANTITDELRDGTAGSQHDSSTQALIKKLSKED